ncbi:MAG: outer membrane beta-barrel protein [Vicinamibacteria bacterium]|nr:outer membrane beta-barrel protein [Vicinamibacteria bacterium]
MRRVTAATLTFFGLFCVLGAVNAGAEGGLGLGAGIVKFQDCEGCVTPLWLTANLRVKVNRNFAFEPEAGWYRHKEGDASTNAFNFGGSALIIVPSEQVDLFGGGGAGAHMFRLSYGGSSETTTKFGFHFLGGVDLKVADSMSLFGAIRYEIIDYEGFGFEDDTLKQWKFYGGLRLMTP